MVVVRFPLAVGYVSLHCQKESSTKCSTQCLINPLDSRVLIHIKNTFTLWRCFLKAPDPDVTTSVLRTLQLVSQFISETAQGEPFDLLFSWQIYSDFNKNVFRALKLLNPGFVVVNETFPIKMQLFLLPQEVV